VDILIMPDDTDESHAYTENPTTGEYFTTALGMIHIHAPV